MEERLGIAGSGTIACGLAKTAAEHGEVVVWARSEESAARARESVGPSPGAPGGDAPAGAPPVTVVTDLAALAGCTFVVEAIAEDGDAKRELFGRLDAILGPQAILATTTSSLSVRELAQATGRPARFAGFHVFNPVPKMALVELAFPPEATPDTRARARGVCEALGKTSVEVPDVPGFVVNRLLFPYLFSAVRLLEETGMDAADVDACMKLGAGHPLGPLALLDLAGLDVAVAIGDSIGAPAPERVRAL
ncbi:MAG TPA: 3-hydroxyacyl-CoA dehydrogenase family protein, partial [Solirubrobacteraceae bacterium]|nr:3-hydroxyacyl-CoA dehydrogenase family protein [Solirubrobacteraceae bacterium]